MLHTENKIFILKFILEQNKLYTVALTQLTLGHFLLDNNGDLHET